MTSDSLADGPRRRTCVGGCGDPTSDRLRTAAAWPRSSTSATASRSPNPCPSALRTRPGREGSPGAGVAVGQRPAGRFARAAPGNNPAAGFPTTSAPSGWYLLGVIVRDRWRRHGLGRELTKQRVAWIGQHADRSVVLLGRRRTSSIPARAGRLRRGHPRLLDPTPRSRAAKGSITWRRKIPAESDAKSNAD